MDIHIFWEGPLSLDKIKEKNDKNRDYGLYQIYGHHPLYGNSVLLYIGLTQDRTFAKRIPEEKWDDRPDPNSTQIYIGRFAGRNKISQDTWNIQIEHAEKLLIYVHKPALNTQNTKSLPEIGLLDDRIYNWESHRDLFPEVSGRRLITSKFEHIGVDHIYDASVASRVSD